MLTLIEPQASASEALAASAALDMSIALQRAAQVIELVEELAAALSCIQACSRLANHLAAMLSADKVAVGLRMPHGSCQLLGLTGSIPIDRSQPLIRQLEAAFTNVALHNRAMRSDRANEPLPGLLAELGPWFAVPLTHQGRAIGAVLVLKPQPATADAAWTTLLAVASPAGACLALQQRSAVSPLTTWIKRGTAFNSRRVLFAAIALSALLAWPLPYRVDCECQLESVLRRFVAAPFEGTLAESQVKSGDSVKRDQVLGRLDGREIEWELSGLEADLQRAAKSRDVNAAGSKLGAAQIDKLEMDRLDQRRLLLLKRRDQLQIRSPIEGIVVSGDLQRTHGAPVKMGQALFEIAPLDELVVEIEIPDHEVAYTGVDQPVRLTLDAQGRQATLVISRIHPRSETRGESNVFIGEALLSNSNGTLRPGMKGEATIDTPPRALGWILFHRLWEAALRWL